MNLFVKKMSKIKLTEEDIKNIMKNVLIRMNEEIQSNQNIPYNDIREDLLNSKVTWRRTIEIKNGGYHELDDTDEAYIMLQSPTDSDIEYQIWYGFDIQISGEYEPQTYDYPGSDYDFNYTINDILIRVYNSENDEWVDVDYQFGQDKTLDALVNRYSKVDFSDYHIDDDNPYDDYDYVRDMQFD